MSAIRLQEGKYVGGCHKVLVPVLGATSRYLEGAAINISKQPSINLLTSNIIS
jgi:hypothetical protein